LLQRIGSVRWPAGRRRLKLAAITGVAAGALALAAFGSFILAERVLGPLPLDLAEDVSTIVLDRNDRLLRAFTTADQRWRLPLAPRDVDADYVRLLLAYEDKRFFRHRGVDPQAALRALWQLVSSGHVVSGASTLTMQVARLLEPRDNRTLGAKLRQIVRAIELERRFTKNEILSLYLRLAPMGGNLEGVRAAALAYFGREPKHLTLGEAALLVALPQSPEYRRPDRHGKAALAARNRVLQRALAAGAIRPAEAQLAMSEPMPHLRRPFPKLAPHLADAEHAAAPDKRVIRLTIDRGLQQRYEALAQHHAQRLGDKHSIAIVAVDHRTGEVLARVGSPGYLEDRFHGPIDMTEAVRSPGSALKPFVYGLAFEDGLAHPETLIDDVPTRFGSYIPKNFDDSWQGTVSVRKALQLSLNVPAVKLLDKVGPARLFARFREVGVELHVPEGTVPNLSMVLGGLGITPLDLARAYAGLARGGEMIDLTWRRDRTVDAPRNSRRILSDDAAWQVADVLAGAPPPKNAKAGEIAYKTGTSYGYRDAWAAGFDGRTTIVVWAGRPDATASPGLTGRGAAAPVLFDAFNELGRPLQRLAPPPSSVLRVTGNAELPAALKRFERLETLDDERRNMEPPVHIAYPPDGARIALSHGGTEGSSANADFDPIVLKAEGGKLPLTWLVNGLPIDADKVRRQIFWQPQEGGFIRFGVLDALGRGDSVLVKID
jgi:penicillin-binding protein 1C